MKTKSKYLKFISIIVICMVFLYLPGCNSNPDNTSIMYTADDTTVEDNHLFFIQKSATEDTIELSLIASNITVDRIYGLAFDIDYNYAFIEFIGYEEGDFIEDKGKVIVNYAAALQSNNPNTLVVGVSQQGRKAGVGGRGTVITLTFKSKASGTSPITFVNNIAKNMDLETISGIKWTGGSIRVEK